MSQHIHINFLGQTVHPKVAAAALEILAASGFKTEIPWPGVRAEVQTDKWASGTYWHRLRVFNEKDEITYSTSVGTRSGDHPFDLEVERPQVFVYINKDTGEVSASRDGHSPASKQVIGNLEGALMNFFPSWEEADWAVGADQCGSQGVWFAQDVIEWCEARAAYARGLLVSCDASAD